MKKTKKWLFFTALTVVSLLILVTLAGVYRFNFTNDDIYIESENGQVLAYNETVNLRPLNFIPISDNLKLEKNSILEKLATMDLFDAEMVENASYAIHRIDLNNDHVDEWLILIEAAEICGTGGCPIVAVSRINALDPEVVAVFAPAQGVSVNDTTTNDWKNLYFTIGDGGSAPEIVKLIFDGNRYADAK